jgi:Holliday junction resolvase-like predicted endonuclease
MRNPYPHHRQGGEQVAVEYQYTRDYAPPEHNFRGRHGEFGSVTRHEEAMIFEDVKTGASRASTLPAEAFARQNNSATHFENDFA